MYSIIDCFNRSFYSAILKDLPDVERPRYTYKTQSVTDLITGDMSSRSVRVQDGTTLVRPREDEVEVHAFPQTWGSTALGFGGIGGSAMTTALTVVVIHARTAAVYFGGQHAYTITDFNTDLMEDIRSQTMRSVQFSGKYLIR